MSALSRTLISFAAFIVNYYLVVAVHPNGVDQTQHVVVWLVFITMIIVSLYQWEASYLFGSFTYLYTIFIAIKTGFSVESMIASCVAAIMTALISGGNLLLMFSKRVMEFIKNTFSETLKKWLQNRTRRQILGRLLVLAKVKKGGEDISDEMLNEFEKMEEAAARVAGFFDGSDPALEKILIEASWQVDRLKSDYARLLLRSAHLRKLIKEEPRSPIENEIIALEEKVNQTADPVEKAQLAAAVEMKKRRIKEIDKLEVCLGRVEAQRLQILETIQATFHRLNALKFSDIQALEASKDAIYKDILGLRNSLDELEKGLVAAETVSTG